MRIQVTADDIAQGQRGNCVRCPVSLALRRQTGRLYLVAPSYAMTAGSPAVSPLPAEASEFVREFDRNREVAPFEFDLDVARTEGAR